MKCPGYETSVDDIDTGDTTFLMLGAALVFLMTPGLGFFYGGMARSKHFLSTIMTSLLCIGLVTVQWFLWGYSLIFSTTSKSPFLGNFDHALLIDVNNEPHCNAPTVPELAFWLYQLMFAIITPALAFGAAAERATMHAFMIWTFVWTTLVYDVVAYWTWNLDGWLLKLGALDFAGGGPVHLASGAAALAYALVLGKREGYNNKEPFRPHNLAHVILGTSLLWFGWFGFNGTSAVKSNGRAVNAMIVTHLAASVGGLWWILMEFVFATRKLTSFGFCSGAVVGLVAITPGSGFVTPGGAIVFGIMGASCSFGATHIKKYIVFDDAFDVFAVHGVGGIVGSILTGIFADDYVWGLDGTEGDYGGWLNGKFELVGYQIAGILAIGSWSFTISYIILQVMHRIPGMGVRVKPEEESIGTDMALMGEIAYELPGWKHSTSTKGSSAKSNSSGGARDVLELQPMKEGEKEEDRRESQPVE